jgi:Asp/Glu/hydantoin racemase
VARDLRIVLVGPTGAPWEEIAAGVGADLARLARPGVALTYHHVGAGPTQIANAADAELAAPYVIDAVVRCERDGFDAVIVDCTDDPGVAAAREAVAIPVVGAGEALRDSIDRAEAPVVVLTGDELRAHTTEELLARIGDARTVALGGTGWSHLAEQLGGGGRTVLDPLDVAVEQCLAALAERDQPE